MLQVLEHHRRLGLSVVITVSHVYSIYLSVNMHVGLHKASVTLFDEFILSRPFL